VAHGMGTCGEMVFGSSVGWNEKIEQSNVWPMPGVGVCFSFGYIWWFAYCYD